MDYKEKDALAKAVEELLEDEFMDRGKHGKYMMMYMGYIVYFFPKSNKVSYRGNWYLNGVDVIKQMRLGKFNID